MPINVKALFNVLGNHWHISHKIIGCTSQTLDPMVEKNKLSPKHIELIRPVLTERIKEMQKQLDSLPQIP